MAEYTLYYWPIPFRGEFIRAALCLAGQSYEEPGADDVAALKHKAPEDQPEPFMAPPVLLDHGAGLTLAQLPAILAYLGAKHGLMPDRPRDVALTGKVIGDVNDVLDELTLFGGRSMWTLGEWESFVEDRLPRWMRIFERTLEAHGVTGEAGYLFGRDRPGLGDVMVAVLWGVMTDKLRALRPLLDKTAPNLAGFSDRVLALPDLKQLRDNSDARFGDVYCGGQIEASIRGMLARHGT
ncbi:MAG: glutathione S-transferase family protein [Pseudomonadota bacterium]